MVEFQLLGSGFHRPQNQRFLTSLRVTYDGDWLLFEAPEGIQIQMMRYAGRMNIDNIFLTGLQQTNTLGLPGLLSTLEDLSRDNPEMADVTLFAPKGSYRTEELYNLIDASSMSLDVTEVSEDETIVDNDSYSISTFTTQNGDYGATVGYSFEESERLGRFDREKAEELGVPVGPKFGKLHEGNSVELEDGRTIEPEQVVGPPRPGRSFAFTGATEYLQEIPKEIRDVDVLFIDGGTSTRHEKESFSGHMNAYEAGTIAGAADVSMAIFTHVRHLYSKSYSKLVEDITDAFDNPYLIAEDGVRATILTPDNDKTVSRPSDVLSKIKGHTSIENA